MHKPRRATSPPIFLYQGRGSVGNGIAWQERRMSKTGVCRGTKYDQHELTSVRADVRIELTSDASREEFFAAYRKEFFAPRRFMEQAVFVIETVCPRVRVKRNSPISRLV